MKKIRNIILLTNLFFLCITQSNAAIYNKIIAAVGNKPITTYDLHNEMKLLYILRDKSLKTIQKDELKKISFQSLVGKLIRQQAIEEHSDIQFSPNDLDKEIDRTASYHKITRGDLENIFKSNDLPFSVFIDKIVIDLKWNSLIFKLYKNKITINHAVITKKLNEIQKRQFINEYLISEIVINAVEADKLEDAINEVKTEIENNGFEKTAIKLSIANSNKNGGSLGWIKETEISKKFKDAIETIPVGSVTKPILLPEGIIFLKVKEKRTIKQVDDLEKIKNDLIINEKNKSLQTFSVLHFKKLRKSINVEVFK